MSPEVAPAGAGIVRRHIGRSMTASANRKHVAGRGEFINDLVRPGMTWLAVVRSPHASARIRGIDAAAARRLPGVRLVLTGAEIAAGTRPIPEGWDTSEIGARRVEWRALA